MLPVELEFLRSATAWAWAFRGGDLGARAAEFGFRFAIVSEIHPVRAQNRDLVVNALQLNKVRNRRMHG